MSQVLRIHEVRVHPLAIPLRVRVEHAAHARADADPVIVELIGEGPGGEVRGYGETLAREYVTGESRTSVVRDIQEFLTPRLLGGFSPTGFAAALEYADELPFYRQERLITAARAAVELAMIDLAGKAYQRPAADLAGWLDITEFTPPGSLSETRYSGVVLGKSKWKLQALLRAQLWYGLRDFKLKVATPGWEERLRWARAILGPGMERGHVTLRADANMGWTAEQASDALPRLLDHGVTALEQPLPPEHDSELPNLYYEHGCDLIADESLRTINDARRLMDSSAAQILNIRIAKVGGLLPALRMAHEARLNGCGVQLGCLVGETSLLTAAGHTFLQLVPNVTFAEGAFGCWLLKRDIVQPALRFRAGGRLRAVGGFGLGVTPNPARMRALSIAPRPAKPRAYPEPASL